VGAERAVALLECGRRHLLETCSRVGLAVPRFAVTHDPSSVNQLLRQFADYEYPILVSCERSDGLPASRSWLPTVTPHCGRNRAFGTPRHREPAWLVLESYADAPRFFRDSVERRQRGPARGGSRAVTAAPSTATRTAC